MHGNAVYCIPNWLIQISIKINVVSILAKGSRKLSDSYKYMHECQPAEIRQEIYGHADSTL